MGKITSIEPNRLRNCGESYFKALVSFIDILGFKEIVQNKSPKEINEMLNGIGSFSRLPQNRRKPYDSIEYMPMVLQFSDSIIRVQPIIETDESADVFDILYDEISTLLVFQGNLMCNGILIRGGCTFGDVCVNSGRVFGPAFNRAYEIESSLAIYPRIVIDWLLLNNSKDNPLWEYMTWSNSTTEKLALISEYVCEDEDGLLSINYLPHMYDSIKSSNMRNYDVLLAHRNMLIDRFITSNKQKRNEKVLAKINWLINYHNKIINKYFKKLEEEFSEVNNSLLVYKD